MVTVAVRSPLPVAWIAMGFELDDKAARELADITGLAVTLSVNADGRWSDVISTLPDGDRRTSDVVTRRIELSTGGNTEIVAILSRSLAEARAPFERLTKVLVRHRGCQSGGLCTGCFLAGPQHHPTLAGSDPGGRSHARGHL